MLKKDITYTNVDGQQVTETFYFNMTKAELMKLELKYDDSGEGEGMSALLQRIMKPGASGKEIIDAFDNILRQSYGIRTPDGKFVKPPTEFEAFLATEAYSELLFELATDAKKASDFVEAIMPQNLREEAKIAVETQKNIFDEQPTSIVDEASAAKAPELMSEEELRAALGAGPEPEIMKTNGLTDDEIRVMSGRQLAAQPREVLLRAYQLKRQ